MEYTFIISDYVKQTNSFITYARITCTKVILLSLWFDQANSHDCPSRPVMGLLVGVHRDGTSLGYGCEHNGSTCGGTGWLDAHLNRYCRHVYDDNMERSIPPNSTSCIPLPSGGLGPEGEGPVA